MFLHGITTFGHYFDEVVKHLPVNNSIYLMDFRGHGLSDPGEGFYTIGSYRDDIQHFLKLINRRVHVVGHSLGGRVGISLTATYPEHVVSLAILDVAPTVDQRGFARLYYGITNMPRPFRNREHIFEFYRTTWGGAKDRFIELMIKYGMIENADGTISPRFDPAIFSLPPEVLVAEMNELWACCRKIRVPTIIVHGEFSDVLNEPIARQLQQAITGSRYFAIKGARHSLGADAPQEVAEILNEFLPSVEKQN
ncbi:MAG: alpha/beta hydrolase [candidate division KSB1 bacterium]|nr:alpha/beta hydrolase [candidate division KSB1 bacterium]MDZ7273324.1 alpha/beta hydrolase [candidate division KSB1 bacterium]MDZ7285428.1 alpha/beta hydrolase [candidate division KSB1 bacterium]MDZ7298459.1 alpha/beta hydrolase [candidate division KSB1 bacterium]MDZ7348908.1 alpha/beta hydrolase [candidate division KSB1 bacterium]